MQEQIMACAEEQREAGGECVLEFLVEQLPDGTYLARSMGACVLTSADTLDQLRAEIREALCCHFDDGCAPCEVRLRFIEVVREERLTL